MTKETLNQLVQAALNDMKLTKEAGMWSRLEITQFNVPYVEVFIGRYDRGQREHHFATCSYYMSESGPKYYSRVNT